MSTSKADRQRIGKRNRTTGKKYEILCINLFKNIGFKDVVSTRAANRLRDGEGIDITNRDELKFGRFPYNVQCKNTTDHVKYHHVLQRMPVLKGVVNVILHKFTSNKGKDNTSGMFVTQGFYAIMKKQDFLQIVAERLELEQLRKMFSYLTPEELKEIDKRSKTTGS